MLPSVPLQTHELEDGKGGLAWVRCHLFPHDPAPLERRAMEGVDGAMQMCGGEREALEADAGQTK